MNLFPTIIVDNFFDDPDYVLGLEKAYSIGDKQFILENGSLHG